MGETPASQDPERLLFGQPLQALYRGLEFDPRLARLADLVESQYDRSCLRLGRASKHCGAEKNHLNQLLRKRTGLTFHQLILSRRLLHAVHLMGTTRLNLLHICFESGFGSMSSFERAFHRRFLTTPAAYRRRMSGAVATRFTAR
jgi:AraC-like DNA-binding protein